MNKNRILIALASAVIAIVLFGTGQNVTITADRDLSGTFGTVTVSGIGTPSDYIEVNGNGATIKCLRITGQYIRVSNVIVSGCSSHGVLITGKNIVFENSHVTKTVTENGTSPTCSGSGGWGSAVKVQVGGENVTIRGNYVYENCGEGIGVTRGININVENNHVRDNFSVNIYLDNSPNSQAVSNTVWCTGIVLRNGNRPNGIAVAEEEYSGWGTQRSDNKVLNNYVADCADGIGSWRSELSTGAEVRLLIEGNRVLNSFRSIRLDSPTNRDVVVRGNFIEKPVVVRSMVGVTLTNNLIAPVQRVEIVPPVIGTPVTPLPVTATRTPTVTPTRTAVPVSPTATLTAVPTTTIPPPASPTPMFDPRCDAKYLPNVCIYIP